jgi:hypothetical protein
LALPTAALHGSRRGSRRASTSKVLLFPFPSSVCGVPYRRGDVRAMMTQSCWTTSLRSSGGTRSTDARPTRRRLRAAGAPAARGRG